MREVSEMPVAVVRHYLAWHLRRLRRGQHEVRRLNAKLTAARGKPPYVGRLLARYRSGVDEDAAAVLQLRARLADIATEDSRSGNATPP